MFIVYKHTHDTHTNALKLMQCRTLYTHINSSNNNNASSANDAMRPHNNVHVPIYSSHPSDGCDLFVARASEHFPWPKCVETCCLGNGHGLTTLQLDSSSLQTMHEYAHGVRSSTCTVHRIDGMNGIASSPVNG